MSKPEANWAGADPDGIVRDRANPAQGPAPAPLTADKPVAAQCVERGED